MAATAQIACANGRALPYQRLMDIEFAQVAWVAAAIMLGGFLKGATGAGTPVVGVPVLTAFFGIHFAVSVFSVLNLVTNLWHAFVYRQHRGSNALVFRFALAGGVGAVVGSVFLAWLPTDALLAFLAGVVFLYVLLRVTNPEWQLERTRGERFVAVAGAMGGVMQGAGGISAPVSVTYLNAMRLSREEFIATISVFFSAMSFTQVPSLLALGLLTADRLTFAALSIPPLFFAMWLGEHAAKYLSKTWFDRAILALLVVIAVRLLWTAIT